MTETNPYWTAQPNPTSHREVNGEMVPITCPGCGTEVDIDGPLENEHFVFAMRFSRDRGLERSNLGTCPAEIGLIAAKRKMRYYLGVGEVYYQGKLV